MTTSIAKITVINAPRSLQALQEAGLFQIRILLEEMGLLAADEHKMAFARMTLPEKAAAALNALQQWDVQNPGAAAAAAAAPPPQAPMAVQPVMVPVGVPMQPQMMQQQMTQQQPQMQMPQQNGSMNGFAPMAPFAPMGATMPGQQMQPPAHMNGAQVAAVDPSALANAQAAVAGATETKTRKPRNSASKAAEVTEPGEIGTQVVNLLSQLVSQTQESGEAIKSALLGFSNAIEEFNKQDSKKHLENLDISYAEAYKALTILDGKLNGLNLTTMVNIACTLMVAEQITQQPRQNLLAIALSDVNTIHAMIAQASSGK